MDILSSLGLDRGYLEGIFSDAKSFKADISTGKGILDGKVIALAFFEPSTRTYTSFDVAAKRLGASVIGFRSQEDTSMAKGETLSDTIRMLDGYADCIAIRHRYDGAAKLAAEVAKNPVINCGDGRNEHPTQSIVDLYTIVESFGRIDGLTYCLMGDLRYSRTTNSLLYALGQFKPKVVYLSSPDQLAARSEVIDKLGFKCKKIDYDIDSVIEEVDVLYVTRIQKERFADETEYKKAKGSYYINEDLVARMKPEGILMHPLPRIDEIDRRVDRSKKAMYFEEANNGVPVRMAILKRMFDGGR